LTKVWPVGRSAGFQPAVSQCFQPACGRLYKPGAAADVNVSADWKSAMQQVEQVGNLRYDFVHGLPIHSPR